MLHKAAKAAQVFEPEINMQPFAHSKTIWPRTDIKIFISAALNAFLTK